MRSRKELLTELQELSYPQFEEVLFRLKIELGNIPGPMAEQNLRAQAVIKRLEQERDGEGIERLTATLADPAIKISGEQYIGYEIEAQVKQIVSEYTQQPFEGREEEKRELDDFLKNNSSGVLLVTAAAGFGKSALLSHWQQTQQENYFIAYHCFSYRKEKTRLVSEAYRHLLKQLYYYHNIRNGQFPNDENRMRDILIGMLSKPVSPEKKAFVIVLDGLDEASETFEPFFTELPEGVFVIASARAEEGDEPQYLRSWTDNAQRLCLKRLPREAIPKWLEQISELATYAQNEDFVKDLDETTNGFPLYLRYLIDQLKQVAMQGLDVRKELAQTPKGFEEYVKQQVNVLDKLDLPDERWEFFALLAVAKGLLERKDVKKLTGMGARNLRQRSEVWQVTRWMQITEEESKNKKFYAFAHPLLAKTFAEQLEDEAEDALQKLIDYCAKWSEHHSAYALRHYAEHLRDVKDRK